MLRRKINPSDYYSKATQLELVQSARALGDAFWFDPSKGKAHDWHNKLDEHCIR